MVQCRAEESNTGRRLNRTRPVEFPPIIYLDADVTWLPTGRSSNTSGTKKVMMAFPAAVATITSL